MHSNIQSGRVEKILVHRIKNKEVAALDILFDWYSPAFFGLIFRIVKHKEIAEEVLQDVFLKIWSQIDLYDESKSRLFTWCYRIARNKAIDARRSHDFSASQKSNDISEFVSLKDDSENKFEYLGLTQLIDRLGETCKKLISMNFFEGYSHAEISESERIPLGTVKTKLRSCLHELRLQMQNEDFN